MSTNVNKRLRLIKRWNVFESGLCLTSGKYEPIVPFAMTFAEASVSAEHFRVLYPHLCFVVLPYGCSF